MAALVGALIAVAASALPASAVRTTGSDRQANGRDGGRQEFAGANRGLERREVAARVVSLENLLGVEEGADRVCREIRGGAHELARERPVPEIVALQLHVVALGIPVVERDRQPVVQREG